MTTTYNCPGLSSTEIAVAARDQFGILPIYNDYDCNAVRTYKVGRQYAAEATTAAANLGIPQGRVVAVDIEPYGEQCPGAAGVDAGFIEGWYDGVMIAGYIPLFYGNGTAGSEFGNAWCRAVNDRPDGGNRLVPVDLPAFTDRQVDQDQGARVLAEHARLRRQLRCLAVRAEQRCKTRRGQ